MAKQLPKRILCIGYNFAPEPTGIGKYSGEMMHWLAEHGGHYCAVLTAYPYYPQWRVQSPYRKKRFWYSKEIHHFASGGQLKVLRCPMYVPKIPTGKKRMLLDLSFMISVFFRMLPMLFSKKFNWVITVAPSFQFGLLGVWYRKVKKAKHLYHIQDLQIEAAQDLGMITSPKLLKRLFAMEQYIFDRSDIISSISEGMINRLRQKSGHPIWFFPNWTQTESFYPLEDKGVLKKEYGYGPNDFIVLYSGAIGEKQGLEAILHTAKALENQRELQFVICGTGPYKAKLEHMAKEMQLANLRFLPLQPLEKFNAFLNMANLHLVIQKEKASDLVMPSKLTTILAVGGLALVTANPDSSLYQLIHREHMGLLIDAENQEALNEGVLKALHLGEMTTKIQKNGRQYCENELALNKVMARLNNELYLR